MRGSTAYGIEIDPLLEAVRLAGEAILNLYGQECSVLQKADQSPLTAADRAANEVLMAYVTSEAAGLPVISEENQRIDFAERRQWKRYWLVDPLDGTKEFLKQNGEFTVNIALIIEGRPALGVVYQPTERLFYLGVVGEGAYKFTKQKSFSLPLSPPETDSSSKMRIVASRSHLNEETQQYIDEIRQSGKEVELVSIGSSLKLCLVAEGAADLYPRFGPTMEWDTAAAQAVVTAAGRTVRAVHDGKELKYNKENLLNPHFIVN